MDTFARGRCSPSSVGQKVCFPDVPEYVQLSDADPPKPCTKTISMVAPEAVVAEVKLNKEGNDPPPIKSEISGQFANNRWCWQYALGNSPAKFPKLATYEGDFSCRHWIVPSLADSARIPRGVRLQDLSQ